MSLVWNRYNVRHLLDKDVWLDVRIENMKLKEESGRVI